MNNQKDIQKTGLSSYGQSNFAGTNALVNKPIYEFANKKTGKLVTALYMVTDCMEVNDALREKLRLLGVELLSDIYKLSTLLPMENSTQVELSLIRINELISFIEIAETIGYISEMNTSILKREFNILSEEIKAHQTKDNHFPFTLDDEMFKTPIENKRQENLSLNKNNNKRTPSLLSFTNKRTEGNNVSNKKVTSIDYKKIKSDRAEKIITTIKDKQKLPGGENGASIKDIASVVIDCSEKTIQRELNDLIEKGQVKKTGAKRWSRYLLIDTNI